MLILARRVGETINIGDDVTVTVLGFNKNGQVKLGIDAPKEIAVHREEIFLKIKGQCEYMDSTLWNATSSPETPSEER